MRIDNLWQELEEEGATTTDDGWLTRHASPEPGYPLLVAIELGTMTRALLLPVQRTALPPRSGWPNCRGVDVLAVAVGGAPHLAVKLCERAAADVFSALAEDVAPRITVASSPEHAISALFDRLRRWQQFLTATHVGLSPERERGLWGELHFIRTHLLRSVGARHAVSSWKAPAGAHQDFQLTSGSIEVKTTASRQPQSVRITSERQLDTTGVGWLFLHVVVVDEREVEADEKAVGEGLTELVATLRAELASDPIAMGLFNDRLLDLGYLDAHASRYEGRRRTVRSEHTYEVCKEFPRLTEGMLPEGIGATSYDLSLSACVPFAVSAQHMIAVVRDQSRSS